ncbi:Kef-type potassium/proton antiporter (CPA2 family) [Sphaerotilus hippei]|uniref:Kef-type potassium/proton antiporter (CPA2 family) n=1 Tax=Sphaerotilus hippei TaxID=744406 RepID=A0A318H7Q0_9BURK|nr:cation:proton antiporter [Sphaerotilus hippei]PXW98694.1 Kef-type potassium/proton antiporter (CPA2 family) [Sphaerotilus hippei]
MHPSMPLIVTLAVALGLSLVLGFLAVRMRLPALVGYLLAGVLIGPFTPGFVADVDLAGQLAEIGVMLLMFGVGLHFSFDDLMAVRRIAIPGAIVQMAVATALGGALALWWGWSVSAALVFGVALSVASTVVLLRALEAQGTLQSHNGRIAIGWLVVEDLAMVLVLVLLPALVGLADGGAVLSSGLWLSLSKTLLAVAVFLVLMLVGGRRVLPWVLWQIASTGSRELFTLCVIAVAVGIAYGASVLFGVSVALGAFFAGLVLRESEFSHRAAEELLPFRDAFAVLFFVSVGMLFDPKVLLERPVQVLAVVAIILLGKSLAAAALVLALRYPLNAALTVSVSLAQIGEFSFILIALGDSLGVMPHEAKSLIVAGALFSIALNPMLFTLVGPLRRWVIARSALARRLEDRDDPLAELPMSTEARFLARHVVLVGHGSVGRQLAEALRARDVPCVVVEHHRDRVEALRLAGVAAVCGDASEPGVLIQAHIAQAGLMVVAAAESIDVRPMIETAQALNPSMPIIVRAPNAEEARLLLQAGAAQAIHADQAVADVMLQAMLAALKPGR